MHSQGVWGCLSLSYAGVLIDIYGNSIAFFLMGLHSSFEFAEFRWIPHGCFSIRRFTGLNTTRQPLLQRPRRLRLRSCRQSGHYPGFRVLSGNPPGTPLRPKRRSRNWLIGICCRSKGFRRRWTAATLQQDRYNVRCSSESWAGRHAGRSPDTSASGRCSVKGQECPGPRTIPPM